MADNVNSNSNNLSFKPNFSSELNIESLISAPLIAASKANAAMATGQTRFLLENCFKKNKDTDIHEPIMITMSLSKGIVDSSKKPGDPDYVKKETINFTLPFLSIIPLSSIAVDKVTVDFDMEITSVASYKPEQGVSKVLKKHAILNGKISNSSQDPGSSKGQYKSQSVNKLKVNLNASPLPLPQGVLTILDLYNKTIQPTPTAKE